MCGRFQLFRENYRLSSKPRSFLLPHSENYFMRRKRARLYTTDYTCSSQVHCIRQVHQNKLHSQLWPV